MPWPLPPPLAPRLASHQPAARQRRAVHRQVPRAPPALAPLSPGSRTATSWPWSDRGPTLMPVRTSAARHRWASLSSSAFCLPWRRSSWPDPGAGGPRFAGRVGITAWAASARWPGHAP